jgi:transposase-like protein
MIWCSGSPGQVRDVLRLKTAGVAINEIARRVGVASSTVRLTLKRLAAAGLGWPLPAEMTDTALEEQLFTAVGKKQGHRRLAEPVARLLARAGHGAALMAIPALGEWPTSIDWLAIGMITAGVYLASGAPAPGWTAKIPYATGRRLSRARFAR